MQAKTASVLENRIALTKGEYAICEYLALHPGQVFTKDQLYDHVFGFDAEGNPVAIAEHIKNIRAKLKWTGISPIETVFGAGLSMEKRRRSVSLSFILLSVAMMACMLLCGVIWFASQVVEKHRGKLLLGNEDAAVL